MFDEARFAASDARSPTCLAKVLARKSRGYEVNGWQLLDVRNVADELYIDEPRRENALGSSVPLAQQLGVMAGLVEAELDATDSGEQAGDTEGATHGNEVSYSWTRSESTIRLGRTHEHLFP